MKWARRTAAMAAATATMVSGCSALSGQDPPSGSLSARSSASSSTTSGARFTDATTIQRIVAAATSNVERIYALDYHDLGKYRAAGLAVTTTPYSRTYRKVFERKSANALRAGKVVQGANVNFAGIADVRDRSRSAAVIVRTTLTTSSKDSTSPTSTQMNVVLELRKIGRTWRIAKVTNGAKKQGTVPANADLRAATVFTRTAVATLLSARRARFGSDYEKARALTSGELRTTLEQERSTIKDALNAGEYDLTAEIVGVAVIKAAGVKVEFVIAADQYHNARTGVRFGPYTQTLRVTAVRSGASWLLDRATPLT